MEPLFKPLCGGPSHWESLFGLFSASLVVLADLWTSVSAAILGSPLNFTAKTRYPSASAAETFLGDGFQ